MRAIRTHKNKFTFIVFYESEEYIEIWRLQLFLGQDKRLEMSLQYTHAEVNVQLQSRVDALEAVEDACTLAEAWRAQGV